MVHKYVFLHCATRCNTLPEVIRPQRPPAPPTDYFQMNLGGYDPYSLHLAPRASKLPQGGYVGCVGGFKIADHVLDLSKKAQQNIEQDPSGVLPQCNMKCDSEPCKNGGICTEDFTNQESSCDCELTSYFGESCIEEKGADFNGESILQRRFVLEGPVYNVKIKLAFSSTDLRQKNTVLLLLQTENVRSYYLLVAITQDGYLKFEEDREESAYGAEVKNRNFLNGARHTVYYTRMKNEAKLLIDRIEVPLEKIAPQGLWEVLDVGSNEVQIGGLNTTDPRLKIYKGYNGCLSNIYVEVNNYTMKPLEEYMLFTPSDSEKVNVVNAQGVRSAQCSADFDESWPEHDQLSAAHNGSFLISVDKTWVEDPPSRIPYDSMYQQPDAEEENIDKFFIGLIVIVLLALCYVAYHMYKTQKAYKLRLEKETDEKILRSKEMAIKLQEPSVSFLQLNSGDDNEKNADTKSVKLNGVTIEGPTVIIEVPPEEHDKKSIRKGSLRFKDMVDKDLAFETLEEKDESIENESPIDRNMSGENGYHEQSHIIEEDLEGEEICEKNDDDSEQNDNKSGLTRSRSQHRGPPTLTTPLPFKIDEQGSNEMLTSNA